MKTSIRFLGTFIFCMLCFVRANAQGLSLSFDLTEEDTLANMIADSKKYSIKSLKLSGIISSVNMNYIRDLNIGGSLKILDLSGVLSIQGATINRVKFEESGPVKDTHALMEEYEAPGGWDYISYTIGSISPTPRWYTATTEIIDYLYTDHFTRKYSFDCGLNNGGSTSTTKDFVYSEKWPKDPFVGCLFEKFVLPTNIETIGWADKSFCPSCVINLILSNKLHTIGDNAFKNTIIFKIDNFSSVKILGENVFENAIGELTSDFLSNITAIGTSAFKNSKILPERVSLPNVTEIGENAFEGTVIKEVLLGDKLEKIANSSFADCRNLEKVSGGNDVKTIGEKAFYGCSHLSSIMMPAKLSFIGQQAFANDSSLVSITIPDAVENVGSQAFANCGLKEVNFGSYGKFQKDVINGCDSLIAITVNDNNEKLSSRDGVLFSKDRTKLLLYPVAKQGDFYEITDELSEIADSAFWNVGDLRSIIIGESVKKIGKNAFSSSILEVKMLPKATPKVTDNISGLNQETTRLFVPESAYGNYYITNYWGDFRLLYSLDKVVPSDGVINVEVAGSLPEYIGFGNQFKHKSLNLSGQLNGDDIRYIREMAGTDMNGMPTAGVLKDLDISRASIVSGGGSYYNKFTTTTNVIGESMFEGCKIEKVAVSETATAIKDRAFFGCPLVDFKIPEQVKEIGSLTFKGALLSSVKIPASTTKIAFDSFYDMTTLKEIQVDKDNSQYMSSDNVLFSKDGKSLLLYPYDKEGTKYNVPESVTSINEKAFNGKKLQVVIVNEGVVEIGDYAFNNLGFLEAISLPSTLKKIGHRAFWECNKLMDITCFASTPPSLSYDKLAYFGQPYNNFSDKTYNNASLVVPNSNNYKSRSGWELFNFVVEMDLSTVKGIVPHEVTPSIRYFDASGHERQNILRGFNVIKRSDGVTKKVIVK